MDYDDSMRSLWTPYEFHWTSNHKRTSDIKSTLRSGTQTLCYGISPPNPLLALRSSPGALLTKMGRAWPLHSTPGSGVTYYVSFFNHILWHNLLVMIMHPAVTKLCLLNMIFCFKIVDSITPDLNVLEWPYTCRLCWVGHLDCPNGLIWHLTQQNGQGRHYVGCIA
jgi:hypothetical protein